MGLFFWFIVQWFDMQEPMLSNGLCEIFIEYCWSWTRIIEFHWLLTIDSHDITKERPSIDLWFFSWNFQLTHIKSTKMHMLGICHNKCHLKQLELVFGPPRTWMLLLLVVLRLYGKTNHVSNDEPQRRILVFSLCITRNIGFSDTYHFMQ